ncbi:MAG: L-seryl-tRNA(Sec) selenium transferase [Coriobacteriia bacterium]
MLPAETQSRLRALPRVDDLLGAPGLAETLVRTPRALVLDAVRDALEDARARILGDPDAAASFDDIVSDACARAALAMRPSLRRVINASGIIVHTNLGRSVLARSAREAVERVASGYSNLEYDLATGQRGSRHVHVEELICRLTGAEAAIAVNNNAAAVMLVLGEFARGGEVVVSRGELVEIGGSFRIPDIMALSGATMVEVGTTNRTHIRDYERALTDRSALIAKIHPSNFRIVGFSSEASLEELVELGRRRGIPVFEDQGSGVLFDLSPYGLTGEPTVASSIFAGATLVSCSGDKLLGGPQAGIVAGSRECIARLKKNPLVRALRLDKMTLAALEATLRLCLDERAAMREIPTLRMLSAPKEEIAERAASLANRLAERIGEAAASIGLAEETSRAGGGALPLAEIPTTVVTVRPLRIGDAALASGLATAEPTPIVARVKDGQLLLDPRTILSAAEEDEIVRALHELLGE